MPGLAGRDAELARLRDLVSDLVGGRGRSVWIEGEPGIGKTALMAHGLAGANAQGCQVRWAQADQAALRQPLRLLLDLLRVTLAETGPVREQVVALLSGPDGGIVSPDPPAAGAAAELLVDLVQQACVTAPVVLFADDLHWADELSLAGWSRLQRLAGQLPLLLVAACRPIPHRDQLASLREHTDLVLELGPLDSASVELLTAQLAGGRPGPRLADLASQAGGNPLYLEELQAALAREQRVQVQAGVAELTGPDTAAPPSLASAIYRRLEFLSEPALAMLRLAALLGPELTVGQLTIVTGEPATALMPVISEAMTAGLLADSGHALAFRHGLIRQALADTTPAELRPALHQQAAKALAQAGAPAEQVAAQLLAAPPGSVDPWLTSWLHRTAGSLAHWAPELAAELLRQVDQLPGIDPSLRDQLTAQHASALFRLVEYEQVEEVAAPVLARTDDPDLAGPLAWTLGYAHMRRSLLDQALAVADHSLANWPLSPVWTARLLALRTLVLATGFRFEEAAAAASAAEAAAGAAGDRVALGYAYHIQSTVEFLYRRNYPAALAVIEHALAAIGDDLATSDIRILLLQNLREVLVRHGQLDEAGRSLSEALALAERLGSPGRHAMMRIAVAEDRFERGSWDDALAELHSVGDLPLGSHFTLRLHGVTALIAHFRDDIPTLERVLPNVPDQQSWVGYDHYLGQNLLVARSLAAERDDQPAAALAGLRAAFRLDPERLVPDPNVSHLWLPQLVRLAMDAGEVAAATAVAAACQRQADDEPHPSLVAAARHCGGLARTDPQLTRTAADAYQQAQLPLFEAHAREDAAVLHARAGETAAARTAYTQAVGVYHGLGARWSLRRADARLRPYGIRRGARGPRRPTTGWDALTPTELTVARLVAAGRSNPDIATQLHLSRRTVETHVSHILTKLDAHSRVDIARQAAQTAS